MDIAAFLADQRPLMDALRAVRALGLPDGWIGAGFVRNAVWDHRHGFPLSAPADVDVVWFDPAAATRAHEAAVDARLRAALPGLPWSAKNQARMHVRNGDAPYRDCADAVARWVETATCVAARLTPDGRVEILAPHGTADLVGLVLRPVPTRREAFHERLFTKRWLQRWPRLVLAE